MMKTWTLCCIAFLMTALTARALPATDDLASVMNLAHPGTRPEQMRQALGKPQRIEERRRRTSWFYTKDDVDITVSWYNKSGLCERVTLAKKKPEQAPFDEKLSARLIASKTTLGQALSLLGMPQSMQLRENKQELHYIYPNSTIRLFFRNNVLVDFTLVGKYPYR